MLCALACRCHPAYSEPSYAMVNFSVRGTRYLLRDPGFTTATPCLQSGHSSA